MPSRVATRSAKSPSSVSSATVNLGQMNEGVPHGHATTLLGAMLILRHATGTHLSQNVLTATTTNPSRC
jgi:hypothetical protein